MSPSFSEKREQKKLAKEAELVRLRDAHLREQALILDQYGKQIARGRIESTIVEIYEKGYVKIARLQGLQLVGNFEKLVSIEGSDGNVQKKSAAGRLAGAVVTGGLNMLSSNIRGDLILTVVTDENVHSISTQVGSSSELETIHALQSAGKAVLANLERDRDARSEQPTMGSLSTELEKLAELHKSGALSDEDFQKAKSKLLG